MPPLSPLPQSTVNSWTVYLIRDEKKALYCGITTDMSRRLRQHQSGQGAKYFRGRSDLKVVWQQAVKNRSIASQLECHIKKLNKQQKENIVIHQTCISLT